MSILKYLNEMVIDESQAEAKQIANSDKYSFTMDDLKLLKTQLDDAKLYKYLGWIARNWELFENKDKISNIVKEFGALAQSGVVPDNIARFKDPDALINAIEDGRQKKQEREASTASERNFDTLWQNKDKSIRVVMPRTKSASVKQGRGAKWCTAADTSPGEDFDPDHFFCKYVLDESNPGIMIYIINDNISKDDPFHKTAIRLTGWDYETHIEEIRDMNNVENYNGDVGFGWDGEYEEYLNEWDIPLNDILEEINIDDLSDERTEFSDTQLTRALEELSQDIDDDIPEDMKSKIIDLFHEARYDMYSYGADSVDDLVANFEGWISHINDIYNDFTETNIRVEDIDWEEVVNDIITNDSLIDIDEIIETYIDDDTLDEYYEELKTTVSEYVKSELNDIPDEAKNELLEYLADNSFVDLARYFDVIKTHKDVFIDYVNAANRPEFDELLPWDQTFKHFFETPNKNNLITNLLYGAVRGNDNKNKFKDIIKSPEVINHIISNSDYGMTPEYIFRMLDGANMTDKNAKEIGTKFESIIRNNYNAIKDQILKGASKSGRHTVHHEPISMILRDNLKNLNFMKDYPKEFKHIIAPIIDKMYNELIDIADEYDDDETLDFKQNKSHEWDTRDESVSFKEFITNYI